ncbi:HupE/UreJ family protein [Pseudanabaena sp. FACHB-2040]|uniref:HupE/UreJ family protein n=1 Tax=Pseudanabaena sp. FACHB-2040 TaxID=2692859 RepID=UPI001F557471|nr:HupE/UreJ family protein [Pseudanabaena sp. FACHB-2040]
MNKISQRFSRSLLAGLNRKLIVGGSVVLASSLLMLPAQAHHATGGSTPTNAFTGFISGLAHPVIGPDHFAFVVAVGLIAAFSLRGIVLPIAFVLATLAGTGLHLLGLTLPGAEIGVSLSVVLAGVVLATNRKLGVEPLAGLGALAGLLHGYAYGEAIVGAEMAPLAAYLAGFAVIQLLVSLGVFWAGRRVFNLSAGPSLNLRFAGFAIAGAGSAFLSSVLLG